MTREQKYKEYKKEWTGYEKANKTTQWHATDMKKQKIQQNGMTRMRKYKIILALFRFFLIWVFANYRITVLSLNFKISNHMFLSQLRTFFCNKHFE
jgi:hypothetical protein